LGRAFPGDQFTAKRDEAGEVGIVDATFWNIATTPRTPSLLVARAADNFD